MSEKVVGLRGEIVSKAMPPDQDVVKLLEETLERARSGDILGVAMAIQHNDECCTWKRSGLISYRLVGMGEALKYSIMKALAEA